MSGCLPSKDLWWELITFKSDGSFEFDLIFLSIIPKFSKEVTVLCLAFEPTSPESLWIEFNNSAAWLISISIEICPRLLIFFRSALIWGVIMGFDFLTCSRFWNNVFLSWLWGMKDPCLILGSSRFFTLTKAFRFFLDLFGLPFGIDFLDSGVNYLLI